MVPALFSLIQNLGLSIIQAMNRFKFKAIMSFAMSIINVIISVILAKKYGPVGAAIGTTFSIVVCNLFIMDIYYYKVIKLDVLKFWKNILRMFIIYIIPIMLVVGVMSITNINGIISVLVYGSLYTLLYLIVTYYFVCNKYEKDLMNKLLYKLKIRKSDG